MFLLTGEKPKRLLVDRFLSNFMLLITMLFFLCQFRCQASCVAATTAIALMLQQKQENKDCEFDISTIISKAYDVAKKLLSNKKEVSFH